MGKSVKERAEDLNKEGRKLYPAENLGAGDFPPDTATLFVNYNGQLYALGETIDIKNDRELYDSLIRLGNLGGTAQRTLYYSIANRGNGDSAPSLQQFMDNIKPKEDRDNGF